MDEVAIFRQTGCRNIREKKRLVRASVEIMAGAILGDGSELALQLDRWKDAIIGTSTDIEINRLPIVFTVSNMLDTDPFFGPIAHSAVIANVLMVDESMRDWLSERWGLPTNDLHAAWRLASRRMRKTFDARSFFSSLENVLRLHVIVFTEPRLEIRGTNAIVGGRSVRLAAREAIVMGLILSDPQRRISKSKLEEETIFDVPVFRHRLVEKFLNSGIHLDLRTESGDLVLASISIGRN